MVGCVWLAFIVLSQVRWLHVLLHQNFTVEPQVYIFLLTLPISGVFFLALIFFINLREKMVAAIFEINIEPHLLCLVSLDLPE